MGDGGGDTLPQTEGVTPNEISTFSVWVVQCVEEEGCRWCQQVVNVLSQCIDLLARWILSNLNSNIIL